MHETLRASCVLNTFQDTHEMVQGERGATGKTALMLS